ncbi:MAG: hypothetical protein GKR91_08415 [Pseudomonadales bacterium]|nr:hypothetical protein [Pseudomonadales bacterium]
MDFELSDKQKTLQNRVREFCSEHCSGNLVENIETNNEFPKDLYSQLTKSGLLAYSIPESLGGEGGGVLNIVLITEELAKYSGTLVNMYLVNAVFSGTLIQLAGSESQREEKISKLCSGELRFAFALTEANAGSDASAIATTAHQTEQGWELSGAKRYTTGANDADEIMVVARTDLEGSPSQSMSVFFVPTKSDGLIISPMNKIAGNSFATCELVLKKINLPFESVLGHEGGINSAWSKLRKTGGIERICVAAVSVGLAKSIFKDTLNHCQQREQFGQKIGKFQAVSHRLADMATSIEAMQLLTYSAAAKADLNLDAGKEISMAKVFAAENVNKLVLDGLHLLGGTGFLSETNMTRYQREALLCLYAGGTTEIQKNLISRYLEL